VNHDALAREVEYKFISAFVSSEQTRNAAFAGEVIGLGSGVDS
jgi:hypothetical protein